MSRKAIIQKQLLRKILFLSHKVLLGLFLLLLFSPCFSQKPVNPNYSEIFRFIQKENIENTVRLFSGSNRLGVPPKELIDYLCSESALGMHGEVKKEFFNMTIPDPESIAKLQSGNEVINLLPIWPNGVRTSTCSLEGVLIYGGKGNVYELDGKVVKDSIVVLDSDCEFRWKNAARLGARAIIFIARNRVKRLQSEYLWTDIPLDVPRFYVSGNAIEKVLRLVNKNVTVNCKQDWIDVQGVNLVVEIKGTDADLNKQPILIGTFMDSGSFVPALAYGADQASGLAGLLEICRYLKQHPPRRSVIFLVTSGHFQAMQGMRHFIESRFEDNWKITNHRQPHYSFFLDFSSQNSVICAQAFGWFVDYRIENTLSEMAVARFLRDRVDEIAKIFQTQSRNLFFDGVNNPDGRNWKATVPVRFAHSGELANLAGLEAISFITAEDGRHFQDTPYDVFENVNIENVVKQTQLATSLIYHLVNDSDNESAYGTRAVPYRIGSTMARMSLMAGFGSVSGQVLSYDRSVAFLPNIPMQNALVSMRNRYRSYGGVRGLYVVKSEGEEARYSLYGVPVVTSYIPTDRTPVEIWGYVLGDGGEIQYTLDFQEQYEFRFPTYFYMNTSYREVPIVVFSCVSLNIFGCIDPLLLQPLTYLDVLDAKNNGMPRAFSMQYPTRDYRARNTPIGDDSAVVFGLDKDKVKILAYAVNGEARVALTNANGANHEGHGFELSAKEESFFLTSLQTAKDISTINGFRIRQLNRHGIVNAGVEELHKKALEKIKQSEESFISLNYSNAERQAQQAWGYALRAHPILLGIHKDVLNALIFYLFILIPFAYFMERLIFGSKKLTTQILLSSFIFLLAFGVLRFLHPAFELTGNTMIIFVAFTMGVLSLLVTSFVYRKFESSFEVLRNTSEKEKDSSVGKTGLALTSLHIGLSNMRRRPLRTLLTCLTLALVTFVILSFTSIVPNLRFNDFPAPGHPNYSGMLIRHMTFDPLEHTAYESLQTEFFNKGKVVRRAWYYGPAIGPQSVIPLRHGEKMFEVSALMGVDVDEIDVLFPKQAILEGGRWFDEGETDAIILPVSVAEKLDITYDEVGQVSVRFSGEDFKVIALVDDKLLEGTMDLDNESFLPADFPKSASLQQSGQGGEAVFRKYVRLNASQVAIVPASTALNLGAFIRSLAVSFPDNESAQDAMQSLLPRTGLNIYASTVRNNQPAISRFSSVAGTKGSGFEYLIIPLFISVIFVFNTMLTSVYERRTEIGIFSALGLSPRHIASLFVAESLIYAVIGAVVGYFAAQGVSLLVFHTGIIQGLYFNYSSLSAIVSVLLVVGVVILSAIYPAKIASQIGNPTGSVEWELQEVKTDVLQVDLPFTVSNVNAAGLSRFYYDWLKSFEEYSIGEIVTTEVTTNQEEDSYIVSSRCWLAPFDLGVQQISKMIFSKSELPDVYRIQLVLERVSGDPDHWKKLNLRFISATRKHFLLWRTLSREQMKQYTEAPAM